VKLDFRNFFEGGMGSGTKVSATGAGAGGQSQAGMHAAKVGTPQKIPPSEFSPSDTVPAGFKPKPGPGAANYQYPVPPRKPGILGAGIRPPYQPVGKLQGGPFGGGCPSCGQAKMKAKMKK
jgi:hypothetical protein